LTDTRENALNNENKHCPGNIKPRPAMWIRATINGRDLRESDNLN